METLARRIQAMVAINTSNQRESSKYEDRIRVGNPRWSLSNEITRKLLPDKVNHQSPRFVISTPNPLKPSGNGTVIVEQRHPPRAIFPPPPSLNGESFELAYVTRRGAREWRKNGQPLAAKNPDSRRPVAWTLLTLLLLWGYRVRGVHSGQILGVKLLFTVRLLRCFDR